MVIVEIEKKVQLLKRGEGYRAKIKDTP